MGSKKTTVTNQTQSVAPPSWTMPGIQDTADKVNAIAHQPTDPLVGQLTDQAIGQYQHAAANSSGLGDWLQSNLMDADYGVNSIDQQKLHDAISSKVYDVQKGLTESTLPSLRSSALEAGAYSGDRATAVLPEMILRDANENAGRIGADYTYQAYNDAMNRDLQYKQILPGLIDSSLRSQTAGGDILNAAAGTKAAAPYQGLDIATRLLQALSGNYGTTQLDGTTTTKSGGLGSVVAGIAGLASAAAGFPGVGAAVSGLFKGGGGGAANLFGEGG